MRSKYLKGWSLILIVLGAFVLMGNSCLVKQVIYVIGGYGWKARFIDPNGYIITDGVDGVKAQYNFANEMLGTDAVWVSYQSDQETPKPYNCGICHTTGFAEEGEPSPTGFVGTNTCISCHIVTDPDIIAAFHEHGHGFKLSAVDGASPTYPFSEVPEPPEGFAWGFAPDDLFSLPGLEGTWIEPSIGCEACHGPGEEHAGNPSGVKTPEDSKASCVKCHVRSNISEVDVSGGLIIHHEQYEMWLASPHISDEAPGCADCHGGHASVIYDDLAEGTGRKIYTNEQCQQCHGDDNPETGPDIPEIGLGMEEHMCIDCHMPFAVKSATKKEITGKDGSTILVGDLRAHIWKINADADSPDDFFTEDGKFVALDEEGKILGLTLDFVCQQCHSEEGITPRGLPAATPYTFDECKSFAPMIHGN